MTKKENSNQLNICCTRLNLTYQNADFLLLCMIKSNLSYIFSYKTECFAVEKSELCKTSRLSVSSAGQIYCYNEKCVYLLQLTLKQHSHKSVLQTM